MLVFYPGLKVFYIKQLMVVYPELVVFGGREYFDGSCNKVWGSNMHFLIDGKWYGDERVSFVLLTFRLNSNIYYSVNGYDELVVCKIID